MDQESLPYIVEPMRLQDIPEVLEIERLSFPTPWPARAYRYEVGQNRLAHYFVARQRFPADREEQVQEKDTSLLNRIQSWTQTTRAGELSVVGYCGFWMAADEAHISTIAVEPKYRRQGIGQLLLITAIEQAVKLGASLLSLEVRVSNLAAQNLYSKYGFKVVGRRARYYSDNREDALIMTGEHVGSAPYQRLVHRRRAELHQRLERVALATSQE